MSCEHDTLVLLGVCDEVVEHLGARRPSGDEVVHRHRHQHRLGCASLVERVELIAHDLGDRVGRVPLPGVEVVDRPQVACILRIRGVAVDRERHLDERAAMALDQVGQIVVPDARIPLEVEMLEQQVDGAVAGCAGAPPVQVMPHQVLERVHGLLNDLKLLVRIEIAQGLMRIAMPGDRVAELDHLAGDAGILLAGGAADDPGSEHVVLGHDLEQTPGTAPPAILPLVVVPRIHLPVGHHHAGLFRLVMNADDDRQPHARRPGHLRSSAALPSTSPASAA